MDGRKVGQTDDPTHPHHCPGLVRCCPPLVNSETSACGPEPSSVQLQEHSAQTAYTQLTHKDKHVNVHTRRHAHTTQTHTHILCTVLHCLYSYVATM